MDEDRCVLFLTQDDELAEGCQATTLGFSDLLAVCETHVSAQSTVVDGFKRDLDLPSHIRRDIEAMDQIVGEVHVDGSRTR